MGGKIDTADIQSALRKIQRKRNPNKQIELSQDIKSIKSNIPQIRVIKKKNKKATLSNKISKLKDSKNKKVKITKKSDMSILLKNMFRKIEEADTEKAKRLLRQLQEKSIGETLLFNGENKNNGIEMVKEAVVSKTNPMFGDYGQKMTEEEYKKNKKKNRTRKQNITNTESVKIVFQTRRQC